MENPEPIPGSIKNQYLSLFFKSLLVVPRIPFATFQVLSYSNHHRIDIVIRIEAIRYIMDGLDNIFDRFYSVYEVIRD